VHCRAGAEKTKTGNHETHEKHEKRGIQTTREFIWFSFVSFVVYHVFEAAALEGSMKSVQRNRLVHAVLGALVIASGLAVRSPALDLPPLFAKVAGDALWAMLVFIGFGWLFRSRPTWQITLMTTVFSCTIEFTQIYHAPWIDRVRQTLFGRLVLGSEFAWLDMAYYLAGILPAALAEHAGVSLFAAKHSKPGGQSGV
jgi:hypothetical protein